MAALVPAAVSCCTGSGASASGVGGAPRRRSMVRRASLPLLLGAACLLQLQLQLRVPRRPSLLFSAGGPGPGGTAVLEPEVDGEARSQANSAFFRSASFLKMLVTNQDIQALGNGIGLKDMEASTGTSIRMSRRGDYYPFRVFPTNRGAKVLVIAGDAPAVSLAFSQIRQKMAPDEPGRTFTFLVPKSAVRKLIGEEGKTIKEAMEATTARISLKDTPVLESQLTATADTGDAYDSVVNWLIHEQKDFIEDMRQILSTAYQSSGAEGTQSKIFLTLTDGQAAMLLGKKGVVQSQIRKKYRVGLELNWKKNGGPKDSVILSIAGLMGDVHAAHREVHERFLGPRRNTQQDRSGESAE